eukprot:g4259.t1
MRMIVDLQASSVSSGSSTEEQPDQEQPPPSSSLSLASTLIDGLKSSAVDDSSLETPLATEDIAGSGQAAVATCTKKLKRKSF